MSSPDAKLRSTEASPDTAHRSPQLHETTVSSSSEVVGLPARQQGRRGNVMQAQISALLKGGTSGFASFDTFAAPTDDAAVASGVRSFAPTLPPEAAKRRAGPAATPPPPKKPEPPPAQAPFLVAVPVLPPARVCAAPGKRKEEVSSSSEESPAEVSGATRNDVLDVELAAQTKEEAEKSKVRRYLERMRAGSPEEKKKKKKDKEKKKKGPHRTSNVQRAKESKKKTKETNQV